ncbi:MAG TPA: FtsK/SpoIIIE domain-containing protein, partial [Anaerolineae bacterium]
VCINAIVGGLLCTATPAEVRFIMVDPKRVELVNFNGIPHLLQPVVVEMDQAVAALQNTVKEMDRRFKLFAQKGARNIEIYNHMIEDQPGEEKLPFLIVIVDELADLMMMSPQEVEHTITRLAQMARATGIHLILATQRPSVDVVTGLIKANFPARISFAVTSQIDSRVVLDSPGAEKLLGRGDMLYMSSDSSKLVRLQGCFVSDRELEKLVTYWKDSAPSAANTAPAPSDPFARADLLVQPTLWGEAPTKTKGAPGEDDLLPQAIDVVKQSHKASVSLLQRKLRIGYSRAARLMELLEEKGIVGPDEGPTKGRAVHVAPERAPSASAPTAPRRDFQAEDDFANWTDEDWADLDKE